LWQKLNFFTNCLLILTAHGFWFYELSIQSFMNVTLFSLFYPDYSLDNGYSMQQLEPNLDWILNQNWENHQYSIHQVVSATFHDLPPPPQEPVSKFNEFKPCLKSPKNWFQLSAGLTLEKLNTILSWTNLIWVPA